MFKSRKLEHVNVFKSNLTQLRKLAKSHKNDVCNLQYVATNEPGLQCLHFQTTEKNGRKVQTSMFFISKE